MKSSQKHCLFRAAQWSYLWFMVVLLISSLYVVFFPGSAAAGPIKLTSMGKDGNGIAVWRIRNTTESDTAVNLGYYGGPSIGQFIVRSGEDRIVTGGTGGTAILRDAFTNNQLDVKASGNHTYNPPVQPQYVEQGDFHSYTSYQSSIDNSQNVTNNYQDAQLHSLGNEVSLLNNRVNSLEDQVDNARSGVAAALAAGNHQYDLNYSGVQLGISTGFFDGEDAYSVGLGAKVNNSWFVNGSVSTSNAGPAGALGATVRF